MLRFAIFPDDKMGKKRMTGLEEKTCEELTPPLAEGAEAALGRGLDSGWRERKDSEEPTSSPSYS